MSNITKNFGAINVNYHCSLGEISLAKSTATQTGNITSGVTLNSPAGVITSVSSTLATNGSATFTVGNSYVKADSVVLCNIVNYSGSNGAPLSRVQGITQGSFGISIRNTDHVNALNGIMKFGFSVL